MGLGRSGKIAVIIGLPVTIMLIAGTMIMNQICESNTKNIPNQEWLKISNDLCQNFTSLTDLVGKFINSV